MINRTMAPRSHITERTLSVVFFAKKKKINKIRALLRVLAAIAYMHTSRKSWNITMKPGPRAHTYLLTSRGRTRVILIERFLLVFVVLSSCRAAKSTRYTMSNVLDKLPARWCRPCLSYAIIGAVVFELQRKTFFIVLKLTTISGTRIIPISVD